jgi:hypothetical protein
MILQQLCQDGFKINLVLNIKWLDIYYRSGLVYHPMGSWPNGQHRVGRLVNVGAVKVFIGVRTFGYLGEPLGSLRGGGRLFLSENFV